MIADGESSLLAALLVGAEIEDLDINDLEERMSMTTSQDILAVFGQLTKGSRNHLRAFMINITNQGGEYAAKYISDE